jgi:hypothetical protein
MNSEFGCGPPLDRGHSANCCGGKFTHESSESPCSRRRDQPPHRAAPEDWCQTLHSVVNMIRMIGSKAVKFLRCRPRACPPERPARTAVLARSSIRSWAGPVPRQSQRASICRRRSPLLGREPRPGVRQGRCRSDASLGADSGVGWRAGARPRPTRPRGGSPGPERLAFDACRHGRTPGALLKNDYVVITF